MQHKIVHRSVETQKKPKPSSSYLFLGTESSVSSSLLNCTDPVIQLQTLCTGLLLYFGKQPGTQWPMWCTAGLGGAYPSSTLVAMCTHAKKQSWEEHKMASWTGYLRKGLKPEVTKEMNQASEVTYCRNVTSWLPYLERAFIKRNATLKTQCKTESTREVGGYFSVQEPPPSCFLSPNQREERTHLSPLSMTPEVLHILGRR